MNLEVAEREAQRRADAYGETQVVYYDVRHPDFYLAGTERGMRTLNSLLTEDEKWGGHLYRVLQTVDPRVVTEPDSSGEANAVTEVRDDATEHERNTANLGG